MDQKEFSDWSLASNKYISNRMDLAEITDQYIKLFNEPI